MESVGLFGLPLLRSPSHTDGDTVSGPFRSRIVGNDGGDGRGAGRGDRADMMSEYYILTTLPAWVLEYIDWALTWLARLTGQSIIISRVSPGAGNEQAAV